MTNLELIDHWTSTGAATTVYLYVDLDGVLVDFEKTALEIAGIIPEYSTDETKKKLRGDFWKHIAIHVKKGNKFFEVMEKLHDADVLWDYIKHHDPTICSATGHIRGAADEKRNWVRRELGHETANRAIFVRDAALKATHAAPGRLLIDDRSKAIDPWIAAGGVGILLPN
jgi:hypothetical protein